MHVPELEPRKAKFKIVAACDLIQGRLDMMAERFGCKTYKKVQDLVNDPDVEVVDIATRSCDHYEHIVMALKAGKHVFIEKPMCVTHAEAKKVQALAAKSKGNLYVRHNRRFEPAFNHIQEIIAKGTIGEVYEVKLRRLGYQRRNDWQTIKRYGGGQLLNWGPHIIDHGLRMLGSPLKSVWSDLKKVAAVGDAEDHLKVILTGKNGRIVDLEISGGVAIGEPEYLVFGSKGSLRCQGKTINLKYLDPKVKLGPCTANPKTPDGTGFGNAEKLVWAEETLEVNPKKKVDMARIWDALHDTLRKGREFPISMDQAVDVMKVVSLAKKGTKFEVRGKV